MTKQTFDVSLTFEELANLLVASMRAETSSFTPGARGVLKRAQFKLQQAVPSEHPLRRELAHAIGRAEAHVDL